MGELAVILMLVIFLVGIVIVGRDIAKGSR